MPLQWDRNLILRAEPWQVALVLVAIPMQFLLSYTLTNNVDGAAKGVTGLEDFSSRLFTDHFATLLTLELWRQLFLQRLRFGLVKEMSPQRLYGDSTDPRGECPAVEVFKFRSPQGHYALSHIPRTNRNGVTFRVGNIVQHKIHGYRGVVAGWDLRAKAPQDWFKAHYDHDKVLQAHIRHEPHYAILVDSRDRSPPQMVYIPQHLLIRHSSYNTLPSSISPFSHIIHPMMDEYFADFNGLNYVPRSWLKALYPKD